MELKYGEKYGSHHTGRKPDWNYSNIIIIMVYEKTFTQIYS